MADIELTRPIIEKLSLQVLYPPGRGGKVTAIKDDGRYRVNKTNNQKIMTAVHIPPVRRGNVTAIKDDGRYRVNKTDHRKIIAASPIPPWPGRKGDCDQRRWPISS